MSYIERFLYVGDNSDGVELVQRYTEDVVRINRPPIVETDLIGKRLISDQCTLFDPRSSVCLRL